MPRNKNTPTSDDEVEFQFSFKVSGALFEGDAGEAYKAVSRMIASFCDDIGSDDGLNLDVCGLRQMTMHAILDLMLDDSHENCAANHLLRLREHFNKRAETGELVDREDDDTPSVH